MRDDIHISECPQATRTPPAPISPTPSPDGAGGEPHSIVCGLDCSSVSYRLAVVACCQCGWRGPPRTLRKIAYRDALRHQLQKSAEAAS